MDIHFAYKVNDTPDNAINLKALSKWGQPKSLHKIPGGFLARFTGGISAVYEYQNWAKLQLPVNWQQCQPNGFIEKGLIGSVATKELVYLG